MKIAVAVTSRYDRVSGHAGRARHWLVWDSEDGAVAGAPHRLRLGAEMVFHHHDGSSPHPLDGVGALIAQSSGEGFVAKLAKRGIDVRMTAETSPDKAVRDYLTDRLSPPRPRPIGALFCKAFDYFSPSHGDKDSSG